MEAYANALLYAIPFFILLMGVEILYGALVRKQKYRVMDTVSSISSGLTNIVKDSLGLVVVLALVGAVRLRRWRLLAARARRLADEA